MRILLVDDDECMCKGILGQVRARDMICDISGTGADCLKQVFLQKYDLIILDIMLADMNGQELLKRLRRNGITTPVLMLSSLSNVNEKIKGFNHGADDYLIKPFDSAELFARIDALVRRSKGHCDTIIHIGALSINMKDKTVSVMDKQLDLTKKEYAILELLALHKGSALDKDVFFSHLYSGMRSPEIKIIDVFVCKIRKKIQNIMGYDPGYIRTVWGRGYILDEGTQDINTSLHAKFA